MDLNTIIAGLLHDSIEATELSIKTLEENLKDYSFKNYKSVTNEFVWRVFAKNKDGSKIIKKDPIYIHKDFAPIIVL